MASGNNGKLRLEAVAALVDLDLRASREADAWIGLDGEPCSDNETELITSATGGERRLAEALRGSSGSELPEPDAELIAGLLRLAEESAPGTALGVGLRQAFLIPDDSHHAPAREERTAAFCDLFRRLAMPGLPGNARERAEELLADLGPARW